MKKVFLLVAVFLVGITTQAFSQHNKNVAYYPGTYDRYCNSEEIRFVENDVLYMVAIDGTFRFRQLNRPYQYSRTRRNHRTVYYNSAPGHVTYSYGRRGYVSNIRTDRFGRIRSIGNTYITYQRNGKVKTIGCVTMQYHRGLLYSVGNLYVIYGRHGKIRKTKGHVNRYNKQYWHDSWYKNNNDWDDDDIYDGWDDDYNDYDDDRGDRNRKRKRKDNKD